MQCNECFFIIIIFYDCHCWCLKANERAKQVENFVNFVVVWLRFRAARMRSASWLRTAVPLPVFSEREKQRFADCVYFVGVT